MPDIESRIDALNRRLGIPAIAQVVPGMGGLPKVCVNTLASSAEIYLHGAQVTSWKPAHSAEAIFISAHSRWEDGRAIRGGIPLCFPWFRAKLDDPQAPAHGFVRTKEWALNSIAANGDGSVTVTLSTASDQTSRRWWPHEFRMEHRITIGASLQLDLIVENTGADTFRFEEALHTYFRVDDIESVFLEGLDGIAYLDNTDGNREKLQSGGLVFASPIDSAYLNAHAPVEVVDPILNRRLRTVKHGSLTTVVWNPWKQGAAALADLGNDEWRTMVCVEASNILDFAVSLAPRETHSMHAEILAV